MENVPIDVGQIGIIPCGEWSGSVYYNELSLVSRNGQSYVSLRPTTGDDPATNPLDWMLIASRGESLYEMMVRSGRFVGTEEEFLQQYETVLADCVEATEESKEQTESAGKAMGEYAEVMSGYAEIMEGYEQTIIAIEEAESARKMAELARVKEEEGRATAEAIRETQEITREGKMSQIETSAQTALGLAAKAQHEAEQLVTDYTDNLKKFKDDADTLLVHETMAFAESMEVMEGQFSTEKVRREERFNAELNSEQSQFAAAQEAKEIEFGKEQTRRTATFNANESSREQKTNTFISESNAKVEKAVSDAKAIRFVVGADGYLYVQYND